MPSLFSKIAAGEIPCYKIAEDQQYLAFLDINPLAKGHTLVIPKKETDYVFDMDDADLSGLMLFSKRVSKAIKMVVPCARIGVSIIGLEVPHTHVHLIPIYHLGDMDFSKPKLKLEKDEFVHLAHAIHQHFE